MMVEIVLVSATTLLATSNTDTQVRVQRTIVQDLQTSDVCVMYTQRACRHVTCTQILCGVERWKNDCVEGHGQ